MRTHGPVIFTEDGLCKSKCFWCKSEVQMPIKIEYEGSAVPAERYYLKK